MHSCANLTIELNRTKCKEYEKERVKKKNDERQLKSNKIILTKPLYSQLTMAGDLDRRISHRGTIGKRLLL